jgi:uncharacterized protein (TIGR02594 family)
MMVSTLQVQRALASLGYDPGPIDGVRGRKTILATIAFQRAEKLMADGLVGPKTAALLFARETAATPVPGVSGPTDDAPNAPVPWFVEAQRLIGVAEDRSARSNPLLIGWGREIDCRYTNDETPWCGLFVGHCIASQMLAEPLPTNPLGARQWQTFGRGCDPQPGAVMVFWRVSRSDGRGHVGFYVAEDKAGYFHILGGNQSDAVNVSRVPKSRFVAARWPATAMPPAGGKVMADATGRISQREA